MIKYILILCFLFVNAHIFSKSIEVTIYCDDNYSPYSYSENKKPKGIYYDILNNAFKKMKKYNIKIVPMPWKRALILLEQGIIFAVYPPYYRKSTRPYLDYSIPILTEEVVVLSRDDILNKPRKEWFKDFIGLKIGINTGFELIKSDEVKHFNIIEGRSNYLNILRLGLKKIDCYINDKISVLWTINLLKRNGIYKEGAYAKLVIGPSISVENGYLGYTNRDKGKFFYKKDFIKSFNKIILNMKKNGEIDKIVKRYTENIE